MQHCRWTVLWACAWHCIRTVQYLRGQQTAAHCEPVPGFGRGALRGPISAWPRGTFTTASGVNSPPEARDTVPAGKQPAVDDGRAVRVGEVLSSASLEQGLAGPLVCLSSVSVQASAADVYLIQSRRLLACPVSPCENSSVSVQTGGLLVPDSQARMTLTVL